MRPYRLVDGELTTKPIWDFFLVKPFTLFKLEYFQVSGLYKPDGQTYSFKMPIVIRNTRYDLHGSFTMDPIGMITQLFESIWNFIRLMFGFDTAGAQNAAGSLASITAALGVDHTTGAPLGVYSARASAAALLGHAEVDAHIATALGVGRAGRFGIISTGATTSPAHGRDWHVGADIHAEEDFFTFAAHAAATSAETAAVAAFGSSATGADAATNPDLHDVCVVALRQHAQKSATDTKTDEPLACAAAGAAAARYFSAEAWSSSNVNVHEAEARPYTSLTSAKLDHL